MRPRPRREISPGCRGREDDHGDGRIALLLLGDRDRTAVCGSIRDLGLAMPAEWSSGLLLVSAIAAKRARISFNASGAIVNRRDC